MKWIDLTDMKPCEPISDFSSSGAWFDVHNEFDISSIEYSAIDQVFALHFESPQDYLILVFQKSSLFSFKLIPTANEFGEYSRFDGLQRVLGVQDSEGAWRDIPSGEKYFRIDFTDESEITLSAERVLLLDIGIDSLIEERNRNKEASDLESSINELERKLSRTGHAPDSSVKDHLLQRQADKHLLAENRSRLGQLEEQRRAFHHDRRLILKGAVRL